MSEKERLLELGSRLPKLKQDSKVPVIFSEGDPNRFFVYVPSEELDQFQEELQELYKEPYLYAPNIEEFESIQVGSRVVARWTADFLFYRAVVKAILVQNSSHTLDRMYKVEFVDFGNTDVVEGRSLFHIDPEIADIPYQAFQCKFYLSTKLPKMKLTYLKKFNSILTNLSLVAILKKLEPISPYQCSCEVVLQSMEIKEDLLAHLAGQIKCFLPNGTESVAPSESTEKFYSAEDIIEEDLEFARQCQQKVTKWLEATDFGCVSENEIESDLPMSLSDLDLPPSPCQVSGDLISLSKTSHWHKHPIRNVEMSPFSKKKKTKVIRKKKPKTKSSPFSNRSQTTESITYKSSNTDMNPKSPNTDVNPKSPNTDVNPKSPNTDVYPKSPTTDVNPKSPTTDVNPKSPNTDVNPMSSDTDVTPKSPNTDVNPKSLNNGIMDPRSPSNDLMNDKSPNIEVLNPKSLDTESLRDTNRKAQTENVNDDLVSDVKVGPSQVLKEHTGPLNAHSWMPLEQEQLNPLFIQDIISPSEVMLGNGKFGDLSFQFLVSHIVGPEEFYVHPIDEIMPLLDTIGDLLSDSVLFGLSPGRDLDLRGTCWAVKRWDLWQRVRVLRIEDSCQDNPQQVTVQAIDFGYVFKSVQVTELKHLPIGWLASLPCLALKCSLTNLNLDKSQAGNSIATSLMEDFFQQQDVSFYGIIFSGDFDSLGLAVLADSAPGVEYLNSRLLDIGVASKLEHDLLQSQQSCYDRESGIGSGTDFDLETWDPMTTLTSETNRENNLNNLDYVCTGFRSEENLCVNHFLFGNCVRGEFCQQSHTEPRHAAVTAEQEPVSLAKEDNLGLLIFEDLIKVDVFRGVDVSSPSRFIIKTESLYVDDFVHKTSFTIQDLEKHLRENLNNMKLFDRGIFPNSGEFVCYDNPVLGLVRAKCVEYYQKNCTLLDDPALDDAQVFLYLVDYGFTVSAPVTKLRKLPDCYLKAPFQAIECCLAGVKPLGTVWRHDIIEFFFSFLEENKDSVYAKVLESEFDLMSVDLFIRREDDRFERVSEILINRGLAGK